MILVNANYFKCVFASFSSLVKGSVEFPGNNETLLTYRLNAFLVVFNGSFSGLKHLRLNKGNLQCRCT